MIKAVLFDLDGTLLYTLPDMALALNFGLRSRGFPPRTLEEVRRFVGSGVPALVERAAPPETPEAERAAVEQAYQEYYAVHRMDHTAPYPGIPELLRELRERGIAVGVVTNKLHADAAPMLEGSLAGLVDQIEGEKEGRPRKPRPDAALDALKALGATPAEGIFVGDSGIDAETGRNAGMKTVLVAWGYRDEEELRTYPAAGIIRRPEELLAYL